jgi:hypothetical protein
VSQVQQIVRQGLGVHGTDHGAGAGVQGIIAVGGIIIVGDDPTNNNRCMSLTS